MANPIGYWGIDIGQCALKALRLELIDGVPTATAFDYIEHAKILSQPDADPEALTREALEKFLSRNPLLKDEVAIGVPGQSGLVRFVKLPPVEEKRVADIVKFEAKQQIPFPLEEVVWDYQKIGGGDTVGGFAMETEIGLFAMKRDIISKYLGHYQSVGAEVHTVQMAPLALCNYTTYELLQRGGTDPIDPTVPVEGEEEIPRGKKRCCVVLDIGTDNSNLIITDGGKILWQRQVNLGGSNFTRALTKEMKLTFAKAEHLKRNAAKSPELAQILKALRPVLTEFVGEVQRSLGFFTSTHRDAHVSYLVGLGSAFKLPGLQKYLAEKLSLDVRKPSSIQRLSGDQVLNDPNFVDNMLTFPIAYGLALQGMSLSAKTDHARIKTNLLPGEVRTDRLIRAKKPAVAAAAAAFLLGTGLLAFGQGQKYAAVHDGVIDKGIEAGKSAQALAASQDTAFSTKKKEIETGQEEIKAIVVGNDERLNWIRVQEVLSRVLPRPGYFDKNGVDINKSNLLEVVRDASGNALYDQSTFWRTTEGERAFQKYRERLSQGIPLEKLFDDDQSQYLAMVNLETVYCRYVPDLNKFLTEADTLVSKKYSSDIAETMRPEEVEADAAAGGRMKPKAVEGGGWVFELRGYTYHKDNNNFVKRSLVRNLQRFDNFAAEGDPQKRVEAVISGGTDPVSPEKSGETVKPRVSHAFLLLSQPSRNSLPGSEFSYIGTSYLDTLATSGAGAGATSGRPASAEEGMALAAGGGDAAAGPIGSVWAPLMSGSAGSTGGGGPGAFPGGPTGMIPMGGSMGAGVPGRGSVEGPGSSSDSGGPGPAFGGGGGESGPAAAAPTGPIAKKALKIRTEFVVCFVWREPTPTDPTPAAGGTP